MFDVMRVRCKESTTHRKLGKMTAGTIINIDSQYYTDKLFDLLIPFEGKEFTVLEIKEKYKKTRGDRRKAIIAVAKIYDIKFTKGR